MNCTNKFGQRLIRHTLFALPIPTILPWEHLYLPTNHPLPFTDYRDGKVPVVANPSHPFSYLQYSNYSSQDILALLNCKSIRNNIGTSFQPLYLNRYKALLEISNRHKGTPAKVDSCLRESLSNPVCNSDTYHAAVIHISNAQHSPKRI